MLITELTSHGDDLGELLDGPVALQRPRRHHRDIIGDELGAPFGSSSANLPPVWANRRIWFGLIRRTGIRRHAISE
jgi:hypothetical protein